EHKRLKAEISKLQKQIYSKYTNYIFKREIYKLYKKYNELNLIDNDFSDTIPHMTTNAIDYLIERGICVCGSHLDEALLQVLEEQKKYQPPISPETLIKTYEKDVVKEVGNIDDLVADLQNLINNYNSKNMRKTIVLSDIKELENEIDNSSESEIQALSQKLKNLNQKYGRLEKEIEDEKISLSQIEDSISQLNIEFSKAQRQQSANEKIIAQNEILQGAIESLSRLRDTRKDEIREGIEEKANKHFRDIISKDKRIKLGEN